MARRPGFFRRVVSRIREIIADITDTPRPTPRRRRRPPTPTPAPPRPERRGDVIDDRGFRSTESRHRCRKGDYEGELATWTIAGWVTTNQDKFNSWVDSDNRDSNEPGDADLEDTDYAKVDIRVAGGTHVLPFVGPFPGGRDELDQHVINWLENDSPPGEWGAGGNY